MPKSISSFPFLFSCEKVCDTFVSYNVDGFTRSCCENVKPQRLWLFSIYKY